jgi:transcriptional regulator with PAS, ATPase and Fis domain
MERGEIAPDFYYRINRFVIHVPPLRDRPEDVEPLVAHFVKLYYQEHPNEERKRILMRTVRYFEQFSWPGNVRELKHTVDAHLSDVKGKEITPKHLPPRFFAAHPKPSKESESAEPVSYEQLKKSLEDEERRHIKAILKKSVTRLHAAKKLGIAPSTLHHVMKRLGIDFKGDRS